MPASRAASGITASLLVAPTFFVLIAWPAAALAVEAPGWTVVAPGTWNRTAANVYVPGDVTGDGIDDLVLVYTPVFSFGGVGTFTIDGDGAFDLYRGSLYGLDALRASTSALADVNLFEPTDARPPRAWDANGDLRVDLAFSTSRLSGFAGGDSSAALYWGQPSGYASAPDCAVGAGSGSSPFDSWSEVGDLNDDGFFDLVTLRMGGFGPTPGPGAVAGQQLVVYNGSAGCPTGAPYAVHVELEDNGSLSLIGSADFDADGYWDIALDEAAYATTSIYVHHLRTFYGGPGGLVERSPGVVLRASTSAVFKAGPDLNADGYPDLAATIAYSSGFGGEFFDLLYYPGGPLGLAATHEGVWSLEGPELGGASASFGDLNGDDQVDLALVHANRTGSTERITVEVYLGKQGQFGGIPDWRSTAICDGVGGAAFLAGTSVVDASGDLDGDGLDDLVLLAGSNQMAFGSPVAGPPIYGGESAILLYYGRNLVDNLSRVQPVGFDEGVAYPTVEYGFDMTVVAASEQWFDTLSVRSQAGDWVFDTRDRSFGYLPNASWPSGEHVVVGPSSVANWSAATAGWSLHFRFAFNWSYPTEEPVAFLGGASRGGQPVPMGPHTGGVFRVEKDLEFGGALALRNASTGREVVAGGWVAGGAALRATGLVVHFEGAPQVAAPASAFEWNVSDDAGGLTTAGPGVAALDVPVTAVAASDLSENVTVSLGALPDPGVDAPRAAFSYRVDADLPSFGPALPTPDEWMAVTDTTVAVLVLDPLSGADPARAEVQVSTSGTGGYGPWQSATVEGEDLTHATARATAAFANGEANYFRFRVFDAAGNGPVVSSDFQVRVDSLHVVFVDPAPSESVWQRQATAEASVTVRDLGGSGVNASSVEYRTSRSGLFAFGPWLPVSGLASAIELRPAVSAALDEGSENFVQWRAQDVAGSGVRTSLPYRILSDRAAPVFGQLSPDPARRALNATVVVSLNLTDGGPANRSTSGVDPASVEYRFRPAGGNWSQWGSQDLTVEATSQANWTANVTLTLSPGPGNAFEVRARDRAGNGPSFSPAASFHLNRAPDLEVAGAPANGTAVAWARLTLKVNASDPDGDAVFLVLLGPDGEELGNNTTEFELRARPGNWTYRVVAEDAFGARAVRELTILARVPGSDPVTPVAAEGSPPWLLILLVAGAVALAFYVRRRGRAPPEEAGAQPGLAPSETLPPPLPAQPQLPPLPPQPPLR